MPTIRVEVDKFRTTKQQKLLKMLDDPKVLKEVNTRIGNAINPFVPMKNGDLRASMRINPKSISWGSGLTHNYAHYQYMGKVYGPNFPGAINGSPAWKSSKGEGSKYPTGRELGKPGSAELYPRWQEGTPVKGRLLYTFGYTTPGTQHHWDKAFKYQVKQKTNLEITRYLKRECKNRGLDT